MSMQSHYGVMAINAPLAARQRFIRLTYAHLTGAIVAFTLLSFMFYMIGLGEQIVAAMGTGRFAWLLILGGFMVVSWMATSLAHSDKAPAWQYAGLVIYTLAEAIIFAPLLWIAKEFAPGVLPTAATITLLTFGALTAYVLISKSDFSFLRTALTIGGLIALGLIVCGAIFGFHLGLWFSAGMIVFAIGCILYTTSQVLHEYSPDQYVAASLSLFAAVALLFWYVLRLLLELRR